jgi:hypothetical protein
VAERFIAWEYPSAGLKAIVIDGEAYDDGDDEEQEAQNNEPLRDNAELIAEADIFALAAEADEAKTFCECVRHVIFLFGAAAKFVSLSSS